LVACTTIPTVGYGDRYPVTAAGRVIAVLLMVVGIALVGVLTASIAAWLVQVARDSGEEAVEPLQGAVRTLEAKLDEVLARLPG
jgi:voltage-gated potassium channel